VKTEITTAQRFALDRDWDWSALELSEYPALSRAWGYSRNRLHAIRQLLDIPLPPEILCVGVAGSLARMEATSASDCDLLVVLKPGIETDSELGRNAFNRIWQALSSLDLGRPELDGIYSGPVSYDGLFDPATIGVVSEDPRAFGFRITLLLECQPVYGETAFRDVAAKIVDRYARQYVELDDDKQWTYLLNDLVRYFKSLCQTYMFAELPDDHRWRLRNLKARHSRMLMYAGLLFLLGESSRVSSNKRNWLANRLTWTPLERLAALYAQYKDQGFTNIARPLEQFVQAMSTPGFRDGLSETQLISDRLMREANPDYQRLKKSADGLLADLLRFALARRDDWADRFFEYWLF